MHLTRHVLIAFVAAGILELLVAVACRLAYDAGRERGVLDAQQLCGSVP